MADEAAPESQVTFKVKTSSDSNHTITMAENATVLDLKTKLSGDDYEKVPTDRMRLIYSGRVMKDPDTLATYKIKAGNTIHMVKSAASNAAQRPAAAPSTGTPSAAATGVPTNMAAGTANNPLAALTGARYAGHMGLPGAEMFGADGGMGAPPGPDEMARMLDDPNMQQMMNEALNNPQMIDMILTQMPPEQRSQMRQAFSNPEFRRMMTNPEVMRSAMAMRGMMGGGGMGGGGGGFPAPGVTDSTPGAAAGSEPAANPFGAAGFNPFAGFGGAGAGAGAGAAAGNPFASLFPQTGATPGQTPQAPGQTAPSGDANAAANPFASLFGGAGAPGGFGIPPGTTPEQIQEVMRQLQAGGGMGSLFGGGGMGASAPAAPADTRPPEEIYASQLRQLNDMGFFDFDENVAALRRSGGSVQGAIEQLLR